MENQNVNEQKEIKEKKKLSVENIVGIVLIAVFLPVIIFNMIVVVKGWIHPDKVPTFLGVAPLVVDSYSMTISDEATNGGAFNKDDIIIIGKVNTEKLKVKDVITYNQLNSLGEMETVTHRIIQIIDIKTERYQPALNYFNILNDEYKIVEDEYKTAVSVYENAIESKKDKTEIAALEADMLDKKSKMDSLNKNLGKAKETVDIWEEKLKTDKLIFVTLGDFGPTEPIDVYESEVQGKFLFRMPLLGKLIATEENRVIGSIVLILVPVGGYFAYELIKKAKSSKKSDEKIAELEAKLAAQEQPKKEVQEQPEESQEDSVE